MPTLFASAEDDDPFDDDARTLFEASAASADKRLELLSRRARTAPGLLCDPSVPKALFDDCVAAHLRN